MTFILKKKKYKFSVEFQLDELVEVPFLNAVLFAKVRLMDGGSFQAYSNRVEVKNHSVKWGQKFEFPCKISANISTVVLDPCNLRISVRKEIKGGRSYQKLGFIDLNLVEFAGSGLTSRRCLLQGYDTRQRQDNSVLRISIKMRMLNTDVLFKVPSPSLKSKQLLKDDCSAEEQAAASTNCAVVNSNSSSGVGAVSAKDDASTASESSGFGSLTKKRVTDQSTTSSLLVDQEVVASAILDSIAQQESAIATNQMILDEINSLQQLSNQMAVSGATDMGHSRNSSNTSQMSKGSGYSSISQSQHSRQSSDGDSTQVRNSTGLHRRLLDNNSRQLSVIITNAVANMSNSAQVSPLNTTGSVNSPSPAAISQDSHNPFEWKNATLSTLVANQKAAVATGDDHEQQQQQQQRRSGPIVNPSSGSLNIGETGSLDRMMKTAIDRKKKIPGLEDSSKPTVSGRVEGTRVNADSLIDELLKNKKLDQVEEAETSGLQLYIARDGTASLGTHEVKSRMPAGVFKQVVMENPR